MGRLRTLDPFAVGSDLVQITWRDGPHTVSIVDQARRERERTLDLAEPSGSRVVQGLRPATPYVVDGGAADRLEFRTLSRPPGRVIAKVATMNDLHLGLDTFGVLNTIRGPGSSRLCAADAMAAAREWGADALMLKGDVTDNATADEFATLRALMDEAATPTHLLLGNHEVAGKRWPDVVDRLATFPEWSPDPLRIVAFDSTDVVAIDTTIGGSHGGSVAPFRDQLIDHLRTGRPSLVVHHHQISKYRLPRTYPWGIVGSSGRTLFRDVARVNGNVVFASGHTHRHRRHLIEGLTVTELGSTKDYPGTWCGYTLYEGGIEATVFRLGTPDAVAWLDRTGRAVGGVWAHWSPGRVDDRCFSQRWKLT